MPIFETWNHLPHWVRAIILGNIIQAVFVLLLRATMTRFKWVEPLVQRVGPKALRTSPRRAGEGVALAIVWFVLSWYVGHHALQLRSRLVKWALAR